MKKIFLIMVVFFSFTKIAMAQPSSSLSVNKGTIENGGSVTATATITGVASWQVTITSSGATNGCTQSWSDVTQDGTNTTMTFSVTCKSSSTGIINFTLSGTAASSDESKIKLSGSKQVTVTPPREKSKNNKLKSLSVEGYDLTPTFSADVNEYSVTVPSTVDKITINATKQDGYASLSGTGEKEIEEGVNEFEIVVTSEVGVSNTYKLTVNVEDIDPIEVTVDGKKYTVVKVQKNLVKPTLFDDKTITIDEKEIPAFYNEVSKYTLVGLKDENGKISLFIYDKGNYTLFNEFLSDGLNVVFLEPKKAFKNFTTKTIKIKEQQVTAYKAKGIDKYIVYAMDLSNGKSNYYTYDSTDKTLQKLNIDNYKEYLKEQKNNKYLIYGLSGIILFLIILLMLISSKNRKLKKYIKLSDDLKTKEKETKEEVDDDFKDIEKNKKRKSKKEQEPVEEQNNKKSKKK